MVESRAETDVLRLAARQHGVLRRDQALRHGLSARQVDGRVACGQWEPLFPGVYALLGAPRTWRQELKAASLWAARDFALSHRTAAALWGFARYAEGPIELTLARNLRPMGRAVVHQSQLLVPHRDLASTEGFRVTSVARTLVDLATDEPHAQLRAAVDQALNRRWTTLDRLDVALERARGRRGCAALRTLVAEHRGGDGPGESELEARVLDLFEAEGLPRPQRQRQVVIGGRVRRLDFALAGTPLVVEADGYAHHATLEAFEKDRARGNALAARGFVVLRWTWAALRDRPAELAAELRHALSRCALRARPGLSPRAQ